MSRPTTQALVGAECIIGSRGECKLLIEEIATNDRFRGPIPFSTAQPVMRNATKQDRVKEYCSATSVIVIAMS